MSTRAIFVVGYILVVIGFLVCQFIAGRPSHRVAKIGEVISAIKRSRVGWMVLLLAWWWLGFHVLARSSPLGS